MTLDDVDSDLLAILVNWCYTQSLEHLERDITLVDLGKLWTLDDSILMPALQNCAMKSTKGNTRGKDNEDLMNYAYRTHQGDNMLKSMLATKYMTTLTGHDGLIAKGVDVAHFERLFGTEFAQDVLKLLLEQYKPELSARQTDLIFCNLLVPEDE